MAQVRKGVQGWAIAESTFHLLYESVICKSAPVYAPACGFIVDFYPLTAPRAAADAVPRLQPAAPPPPAAAAADVQLLVGPDFSLRCIHPGGSLLCGGPA
jgi:hypothetical protein